MDVFAKVLKNGLLYWVKTYEVSSEDATQITSTSRRITIPRAIRLR